MAYLVRYSAHIKEDIERGWSSWSFGADGLCGPLERLVEYLQEIIDSGENAIDVSGFILPLYRFEVEDDEQFVRLYAERGYFGKLGQLYPEYWVLVDETKGGGLACCDPVFDTEEQARKWIASVPWSGPDFSSGTFVNRKDIIKICASEFEDGRFGWHILEVDWHLYGKRRVKVINKTPRLVRVGRDIGDFVEFPPDAQPAQVRRRWKLAHEIMGIPVLKVEYGEIDGLPEPEDGTYYIVSTIVKEAALAAGRSVKDLLVPDEGPTAARINGQIYAVLGFIAY